jgi:hypothetical protein
MWYCIFLCLNTIREPWEEDSAVFLPQTATRGRFGNISALIASFGQVHKHANSTTANATQLVHLAVVRNGSANFWNLCYYSYMCFVLSFNVRIRENGLECSHFFLLTFGEKQFLRLSLHVYRINECQLYYPWSEGLSKALMSYRRKLSSGFKVWEIHRG